MGSKWYEIDITYYIIVLFSKLGIVTLQGKKHKEEHEKDLGLAESIIGEQA
jgi:fatty-acid desaturase